MRRFEHRVIGIDEGSEILFTDFEHDGPMWAGTGPRSVSRDIEFSEPFEAAPSVQVSIEMWDISNAATSRIDVRPSDETRFGFTITAQTWGDTRIARLRVRWRAIGELKPEDDWELY